MRLIPTAAINPELKNQFQADASNHAVHYVCNDIALPDQATRKRRLDKNVTGHSNEN
jgi:hypothetical protein